jgi:hypothetical protein
VDYYVVNYCVLFAFATAVLGAQAISGSYKLPYLTKASQSVRIDDRMRSPRNFKEALIPSASTQKIVPPKKISNHQ